LKTFEIKKNIDKILNDKKKIIILFIIGIFLIIFPNLFSNFKNDKNIKSENYENYEQKMRADLENMISSINGAGKTKVLITFESEKEAVYATENKKNNESITDKTENDIIHKKKSGDHEKKYIITKNSDGSEHPLMLTKIHPKVKGTVIICEGAEKPRMREKITEAVSIALNISTNRVCVIS
jgi:stage III sporulation protein AG